MSADVRTIESHGLKVDNSSLTGESEPLERRSGKLPAAPGDVLEADNVAFAGTFVTSGSGTAVIVATAAETRLGGISTLTGGIVRRPSPLQIQLSRMVRVIGAVAVAAGVIFFLVSGWMQMGIRDSFLFSVGIIVALVPEGLLPTFTLSLAMWATRMARRRALVRHLEAVETLGATTVICTDKTARAVRDWARRCGRAGRCLPVQRPLRPRPPPGRTGCRRSGPPRPGPRWPWVTTSPPAWC